MAPNPSVDPVSSRSKGRGFRRRLSPVLLVFSAILLAYWAAAALVVGADPYDLYRWGLRADAGAAHQPRFAGYLLRMAARDPKADLILIGGSTSTTYSAGDLRDAFPGARDPWNISYHASRALDRHLATTTIVKQSAAPRVLIVLDWLYARSVDQKRDNFPVYLYDDDPFNDLRMVDQRGLAATARLLRTGSSMPDPAAADADEVAFNTRGYESFQTQKTMARIERLLSRHRAEVDRVGATDCGAFPAFNVQFLPALRALAAQGKRVDIIVPPYSLAMYYEWVAGPKYLSLGGSTFLSDQLLLRRCMVEVAATLPGVSVSAIDIDPRNVSDLGAFRDTSHLYDPVLLKKVLLAVDDPAYRLTPENVDAYAVRLRAAAKAYQLRNSKLGLGNETGS